MKTPETIHQDILMGLSFQVEPDITLICDDEKLKKQGCYGAPDFVIEIVSPSNRKMDYVRKLALYKEAGVREYWIVDPKYERVTVYDLESGAEPTLHPFSERIRVGVYDDLYLDIANRHGTLEEVLAEERQTSRETAHAEGMKEGENRLAGLTTILLREGRTDDLARAVSDLAYREKIYRENAL
ncbi:MAG: Uma2 family endonuclease [Lachnospiraceae bacterium]|nr:Uma2 family endonuclease [Lachnospiraceae bacterium]